ncbi:uncharacterized protein TNCV_1730601 [Trichonephila clavipes]|nr:uncharacterized protein TNCV_1730601 [Trichonephila clavipes]
MAGQIYLEVILKQHVCLFRGAMTAENLCLWMGIVIECLQSEDITRMNWSSILTGLGWCRACVGHACLTSCSPSTTSYMSTGTAENIA